MLKGKRQRMTKVIVSANEFIVERFTDFGHPASSRRVGRLVSVMWGVWEGVLVEERLFKLIDTWVVVGFGLSKTC